MRNTRKSKRPRLPLLLRDLQNPSSNLKKIHILRMASMHTSSNEAPETEGLQSLGPFAIFSDSVIYLFTLLALST